MMKFETETTCNSQEWIGAGRYHPDWTLKDWKRELERSTDLWWAVNRLEEESVTKNVRNTVLFRGHLSDQHRFTDEHEGNEYVLLQRQRDEPDVFWLYDLVVETVSNKSNIQIQLRRIFEVYDTVDGMILGNKIVEHGEGESFLFDGQCRHVVGDKESEPLDDYYGCLPEEELRQVYTTVQNWAYRKTH
ncbi:MAG: hypothetical protein ABJE63_11880 [Lentilitoribacter sp.]